MNATAAPLCGYCDATPATQPTTLCTTHGHGLTTLLRQVPSILDELDTSMTRQAKLRPTRGLAAVEPVDLPFNLNAADSANRVRAMLLPWVRFVHAGTGAGYNDAISTPALARGLSLYAGWILQQPEAGKLLDELKAMVEDVRGVIDLRIERVFVGTCKSIFDGDGNRQSTCPEQLYAPASREETTCPRCKATHHVKDRQKKALAAAQNRVLPPQMIARALTRKGEVLDVERIYNWSKRGLLKPASVDPRTKRKMYRLGDVMDVMAACDASPHNPKKALEERLAA